MFEWPLLEVTAWEVSRLELCVVRAGSSMRVASLGSGASETGKELSRAPL